MVLVHIAMPSCWSFYPSLAEPKGLVAHVLLYHALFCGGPDGEGVRRRFTLPIKKYGAVWFGIPFVYRPHSNYVCLWGIYDLGSCSVMEEQWILPWLLVHEGVETIREKGHRPAMVGLYAISIYSHSSLWKSGTKVWPQIRIWRSHYLNMFSALLYKVQSATKITSPASRRKHISSPVCCRNLCYARTVLKW